MWKWKAFLVWNPYSRHTTSALIGCLIMGTLLLPVSSSVGQQPAPAKSRSEYLKAALAAAAWIRSSEVRTDEGLSWPIDPTKPGTIVSNLYSGTSGIVLFFTECYYATKDQSFLNDAKAGADFLIANLPREASPDNCGLYTGVGGVGFALEEVYEASAISKYRDGAKRCVQLIHGAAGKTDKGYTFSGMTDIISGASGIGLYLLSAARAHDDSASRELATGIGRHLVATATRTKAGLSWPMAPGSTRLMPNFTHGTAGVAYFLSQLYRETGDEAFLTAATAGAEHLRSIANTEGGGFKVGHHSPGGESLFYLGWCHGPVGTARLFRSLDQAAPNQKWRDLVGASASAIERADLAKNRTPGFWNNVGMCCGTAGVADFFLDMHRVHDSGGRYLELSKRLTKDLLDRSTREGDKLKWIQSEHRVRPKELAAQTGYAQGAAGIGMWLLKLDAAERGTNLRIRFPDSPF